MLFVNLELHSTPCFRSARYFMRFRIPLILALLCFFLHPVSYAEEILILSDLHLTEDVSASLALFEAIIRETNRHDVLLILGDCANSGRPSEHRSVFSLLQQIVNKTGKEVYILPGNHDLSGGFSPEDFADYYTDYGYKQAFSRDPSGAGYAVYTAQDTCLIMLDTNGYAPDYKAALHGCIRDETLAWLDSVLKSLSEKTSVIVAGHYPILPFKGSGNDDTENAEALAALLQHYRIPLYLCGHRHSNYTLHTDNLRQISIGVPFAYPAWEGLLTQTQVGWLYDVQPLYSKDSPAAKQMLNSALELGKRMASGSLEGTSFEGDAEAEEWFMRVFSANLNGTLNDTRESLLADKNCEKWRKAEVRSAVKPWILSLLQTPQEDVRHIVIRSSQE